MIQWILLGFFVLTITFIVWQCSRVIYRAVPVVGDEDAPDDESDGSGDTEETDVSDGSDERNSATDPSSVEDSEVDVAQEVFAVVDEFERTGRSDEYERDEVTADGDDSDGKDVSTEVIEEVARAEVSSDAAVSHEEFNRGVEAADLSASSNSESADSAQRASSPLPSADFDDSDDDVFLPENHPVVPSTVSFGPPPGFDEMSHEPPRYFLPLALLSDSQPPSPPSPPLFCCDGPTSWLPPFCIGHLNLLYAHLEALIRRAERQEIFIHLGDITYGRLLHDQYLGVLESDNFFSGLFDLAHVYSLFLRARIASGSTEEEGEHLMDRWAGVRQLWIRLVQRTMRAARREYVRVLQAAYDLWLQQLQQHWARAVDRWMWEQSRLQQHVRGYKEHSHNQLHCRQQQVRREGAAAPHQQDQEQAVANRAQQVREERAVAEQEVDNQVVEIDANSMGYDRIEIQPLWNMNAIYADLGWIYPGNRRHSSSSSSGVSSASAGADV